MISIAFFKEIGFVIIPIATSISTWIGVAAYLYLLNNKNFLLIKNYLPKNIIKIILNTLLMSFLLVLTLDYYADYLDYNNKYKSVYLLLIVSFVGGIYLISCYLTGILKTKNFKTN